MPDKTPDSLPSALLVLKETLGVRQRDSDPVEIVHAYRGRGNREVAAFIVASLAYGGVRQIDAAVKRAMSDLGRSPARSLRDASQSDLRRWADGFTHRWTGENELWALFTALGEVLRRHGSLERLFVEGLSAGDSDITHALEHLMVTLRGLAQIEALEPSHRRLSFLLPRPSGGSACKRANLFLRWVVRPEDGVDLGLWRGVSPSLLVVPLDTHLFRIASNLGFTQRRTADWKAAVEITRALRSFDPEDPVSCDFALTRLGIMGVCRDGACAHENAPCPLRSWCRAYSTKSR